MCVFHSSISVRVSVRAGALWPDTYREVRARHGNMASSPMSVHVPVAPAVTPAVTPASMEGGTPSPANDEPSTPRQVRARSLRAALSRVSATSLVFVLGPSP
uniref:Uncharacterized protein n=1 Tax=Knipowitschia caucasica TaxID=637954 RepID=A0AAV2KNW5_KNICA